MADNDEEVKMMRDFLSSLVRDMRQRMSDGGAPPYKNMNASGRSRKLFTFDIQTTPDAIIGILYGPEHVIHLERGRGPGKFPPPQSILEWMDFKGIIPRDGMSKKSLAYLIGRSIAEKGTRMSQKKHRSGILSEILEADRITDFFDQVYEANRLKVRVALSERLDSIGEI